MNKGINNKIRVRLRGGGAVLACRTLLSLQVRDRSHVTQKLVDVPAKLGLNFGGRDRS